MFRRAKPSRSMAWMVLSAASRAASATVKVPSPQPRSARWSAQAPRRRCPRASRSHQPTASRHHSNSIRRDHTMTPSASDHFDGSRFVHPTGRTGQPLSAVPRMLLEPRTPWPARVDDPPHIPPGLDGATAVVSFIGHSTFLIQTAAGNVLTDPMYSQRAGPLNVMGPRRVRQPAYASTTCRRSPRGGSDTIITTTANCRCSGRSRQVSTDW